MAIKTVLLLRATGESLPLDRGPAHCAVQLARAFDAHLRALLLELDVAFPRSAHRWAIAEDLARLSQRNVEARQEAQQLQDVAKRAGVSVDLVTKRSDAYTVPEVAAEHARLHDITVAGVTTSGLSSEQAIAEGDAVVEALGRRGVQSRFEQAKLGGRPIAQAIASFVAERRADLLVMGGYGHARLREFILGGATREIFRAPSVPTLLSL